MMRRARPRLFARCGSQRRHTRNLAHLCENRRFVVHLLHVQMIICQDRLGTDVGKALKTEHFVEQAVAWVRLDISGGADGGGRGVNLTVQ
eukprot:COSAG06_NODE_13480_length_1253_cov_2.386482_1_plen_89_part_01